MKMISFLMLMLIIYINPAHANDYSDFVGKGNVEINTNLFFLRSSRNSYASDWNKIEAKRLQFVKSGNTQMAKVAKEEADKVARRYQQLDEEIKALELLKARNDLRN